MSEQDLLSPTEAAALTGCSPRAINLAIREGRLPAVRVGRQNVIRREDVEQYHPRLYSRKGKVTE